MPYNLMQNLQNQIDHMNRESFYPYPTGRGLPQHYTKILNVEENVTYHFGNDYSRILLKNLVIKHNVEIMVCGRPVFYNEDTNKHEYDDEQWIKIDRYNSGNSEYPEDHFIGLGYGEDHCRIFFNDITLFLILPTQIPKEAKIYKPKINNQQIQ